MTTNLAHPALQSLTLFLQFIRERNVAKPKKGLYLFSDSVRITGYGAEIRIRWQIRGMNLEKRNIGKYGPPIHSFKVARR